MLRPKIAPMGWNSWDCYGAVRYGRTLNLWRLIGYGNGALEWANHGAWRSNKGRNTQARSEGLFFRNVNAWQGGK